MAAPAKSPRSEDLDSTHAKFLENRLKPPDNLQLAWMPGNV